MYGASVLALNGVIKAAEVRVGRSGKELGSRKPPGGAVRGSLHLQPLLGARHLGWMPGIASGQGDS